MKKRAIEAAVILAAVIALFFAVNVIVGGVSGSTRKIDGEYFNTGERELILCLMTEEGTDQLSDFSRLESLTLTPYKYAAARSLEVGDKAYDSDLYKRAEDAYSDCTDLADLSFLSPLTELERLDVSCCAVSDLSFASGMTRLEELNISRTRITDLSPLLDMPSLKTVTVDMALKGDITDSLSEKGVEVIFSEDREE